MLDSWISLKCYETSERLEMEKARAKVIENQLEIIVTFTL